MRRLGPGARGRLLRQAARWFVRLHSPQVSLSTLAAFRRWRSGGGAQAAFADIDAVWRASSPLRADPEITAALRQAVAAAPRQNPRRAAALGALGAAGAALALAIALFNAPTSVSSAVGERRSVRLADGSTILLDTDTRVAVRLGPQKRELRLLKGQALVAVAHDAKRPFVVEIAGTTVTALGTRFDVRREGGRMSVGLLEGRVRVSQGASHWIVGAGETLQLSPGRPARRTLAPPSLDWTRDRLVFDGAPLGDAIAEVNRYRLVPIRLDPRVDRGTPVSGVFDAKDPVAFITAVRRLMGLDAVDDGDGIVLQPRRRPNENILDEAPGGRRVSSVYPSDSPHPET